MHNTYNEYNMFSKPDHHYFSETDKETYRSIFYTALWNLEEHVNKHIEWEVQSLSCTH